MKCKIIFIVLGLLLFTQSAASASERNGFQREQARAYIAMFMARLERNAKLIEMAQRTDPTLINSKTRSLINDDINKIVQGMSGLINPEPRFDNPRSSMQVPDNNYLLKKGLRR